MTLNLFVKELVGFKSGLGVVTVVKEVTDNLWKPWMNIPFIKWMQASDGF